MGTEIAGKPTSVIGLLTDFGLADPYVGEMKATILSISPEAKIVDITHQVAKFNVLAGSFLLASSAPYFLVGSVLVAVVDPRVGSSRRPIVIETQRRVYVGPDNGLLVPASESEGILHVYELRNKSIFREDISSTFHGMDIFAPAAAHITNGFPPEESGPEIFDHTKLSCSQASVRGRSASCRVLHTDGFGNLITNLSISQVRMLKLKVGQNVAVSVGKRRFTVRFVRTYADVGRRGLGLLVSSHGFVELASREGSAAKRTRINTGGVLRLSGLQAYRSGQALSSVRLRRCS